MLSNVDIRIILENVRLLFTQKLIEKGLYFKIMADDNLPNVFVDSYRFEQLFINLLSNSIKYTENGGITIELKKSESKFIIICSDTGVGIPLEDQDRIFERFYISEKSRSRKYDGTGIGLSIVKHILMLHNGTIELDKEYRNGTRFIITI
jgi:two-component system phosphate regulon sensor histidine kinase PhoR